MIKRVFVLLAVMLVAAPALADDTVQVLKTQVIYGRPAKPLVSTDVSKLRVDVGHLTLGEIQQPFAGRIAPVVQHAPF
jgi:hypothetical protein